MEATTSPAREASPGGPDQSLTRGANVSLETNPTRPAAPAGAPRGVPTQRGDVARALRKRFRMPGTADPKVRLRRLAGVSVWAAVLGFGGLVVGLRVVIGLFTSAPSWYLPTMCVLGIAGIALTVGAFASVHRWRLPWLLLAAATVVLIVSWNV